MQQLTPTQIARLKQKFRNQRQSTVNRIDKSGKPIIFKLTFEEWLDLWVTSGHLDKMGRNAGCYVMSRRNDLGNYEMGNVFIQPVEQNISEGHRGIPKNRGDYTLRKGTKHSQATRDKMRQDRKGHKYQKPNTPIMTPTGEFSCVKEAAEYLGIRPEAIHYYKRKYPTEWYYIIK